MAIFCIINKIQHTSFTIGFVFSISLTAEIAKSPENKEYVQKLCDLGVPGGKTQIGFVFSNMVKHEEHEDQETISINR